jgi:hypothetical protein
MDWGIFLPDLDLEGFPDLCSHEAVLYEGMRDQSF